MRKRAVSLALCLCMVLSLLPLPALATEKHPFTDVAATDWFNDSVQYVYERKLMEGTTGTTFSPYRITSRGMLVTILYRLENSPTVNEPCPFPDVASGRVFEKPITWAASKGIVTGYASGDFGPDDNLTRQQMAAILYRYAHDKGYDTTASANLNEYTDAESISNYARTAMAWANAKELINGTNDKALNPAGNATRAQAAAILTRFCENVPPIESKGSGTGNEGEDNGTTDGDEDSGSTIDTSGGSSQEITYVVSFDLNYSDGGIYQELEVLDGEKVTAPTNPKRSKYTFLGWYTAASGGKKFNFNTKITSDITLYAHWSSNSSGGSSSSGGYTPTPAPAPTPTPTSYTVSFNSNGGSAVSVQTVNSGGTASVPTEPTKNGAIFIGWYKNIELTEAYDFTSIVNSNVILYAKWSDSAYTAEYQQLLERKQSELNRITELNNGTAPEIVIDSEDTIPSFILGRYSDAIVTDYDTAIASLIDIKNLMEFSDPAQEFANSEAGGSNHTTIRDTQYYHLQQIYNGYPVYGKELVIATDENGVIKSMNGDYDPLVGVIDERIELTEADAIVRAEDQGFGHLQNGQLVVYSLNEGYNEFAWVFDGALTVFVSAVSGEILDSWTNINTAYTATIGRGENESGGTVAFNTVLDDKGTPESDDDEFIFYDSVRNIYYKDLERSISASRRDSNGNIVVQGRFNSSSESASYPNLTDADNIWTNSEAITLQENLSQVYDYYLETIGLMSYDGNGGTVYAFVNDMYSSGTNAFNWGPFNGGTMLAFGAVAGNHGHLDTVGHEFTHAVQNNRVAYNGEGGALMEAYADLGGELVQAYVNGTADWVHGDRSLVNPGAHSKPSKYEGWNWGDPNDNDNDNGYVHQNSTVVSHAVYSIFQSGINDITEMTELLYRTWQYLSRTAKFIDYRMAMCAAATDMNLSFAKKESITTAFDNANIKPESYGQFLSDLLARNLVLFTVNDSRGRSIPSANIAVRKTDGSSVAALYTDGHGISSAYMYNGDYNVVVSATGYTTQTFSLKLDAGFSLNLLDIKTVHVTYRLPDNASGQSDAIKCAIGGHVKNAITGEAVEGVRLVFRKGYQVTSGPTSKVANTDALGHFQVEDLDYGYYTVAMQKEGYITSYQVVQAAATNWEDAERADALNQNWTISPGLSAEDTIRIVLTWGENPEDLDSHITGTLSNGNSFHVYFDDERATDSDGTVVAFLDIDDVTSYGPETVTLHWAEGVTYYYYVHLYAGTGTLSTSQAKLQIYSGSVLLSSVDVPSGSESSRIWNVFTFKDGDISMVNTFSSTPFPQ